MKRASKINILLKSILLSMLFALSFNLNAQAETITLEASEHTTSFIDQEVSEILEIKSPPVTSRIPSSDVIKKYKSQYRFNYKMGKEKQVESGGFFALLFAKLAELILKIIFFPPTKWIALIIILIFVIRALIKAGYIGSSSMRKNAKINGDSNYDPNNLDDHLDYDFDKYIAEAINLKNYRLAIRIHFLKNLKALADKELIKWDKKKTNSNYIYEITDTDLRKNYSQNALYFDYIWYGEFAVSEVEFNDIHQQYNEFYNHVMKYERI